MFKTIIEAMIIGFFVALPVGPVGVLCINRAMTLGFKPAFIVGLGAATADAIYGLVAVLGVTTISVLLSREESYIKLIGGLLLCLLGIKIILENRNQNLPLKKVINNTTSYFTTLGLTLMNPATIIAFTAVFAALGLGSEHKDLGISAVIVASVFTGSLLWWLMLSFSVSMLKEKLTANFQRSLTIISGIVITVFGIIATLDGYWDIFFLHK
ncbi:MAG: LysE family transporter [Gammaproteobacteria bacterium]